jgi:hypothetical protein
MPASKDEIELILSLGGSKRNVSEVIEELRKLKEETKDAGDGFDKTGKATNDFSREILNAGRALQDFTQGGVGGILNNIEGLLIKFPAAAGVVTILATAAYAATPIIKNMWSAWMDGSNEVPKALDSLAKLNESLAANKKRVEELKDKQTLTNAELGEFNRLAAESTKLEKEANAERERRNTIEALRKKEAGDKDSAEVAAAAIDAAGGVDATIAAARKQLLGADPELQAARQNSIFLQKRAQERRAADPNGILGEAYYNQGVSAAQARVAGLEQGTTTTAEDLVARASKGEAGAIRELARLLPQSAFGQATPEAIRAQDAEVQGTIVQGAALHDKLAKRRAVAAAVDDATLGVGQIEQAENEEGERMRSRRDINSAREQRRRGGNGLVTSDEQRARGLAADAARAAAIQPFLDTVRGQAAANGVNASEHQVRAGAQRLQNAVKQGADPMAAAQQVISDLIANQQMLNQRQASMWNQARAKTRQVRAQIIRNRP